MCIAPLDKIEYAISTQEMDSMLFEITKFLLQVSCSSNVLKEHLIKGIASE